jgi:hypothetical protein
MRASLQRILYALTGRIPAAAKDTIVAVVPSMRRRRAWAGLLDELLEAASRKPAASLFPHPYWDAPLLLRCKVVRACQAELLVIKEALVDQRQPISAQALQQLKGFRTNPSTSPLFGTDPARARRAAHQLQSSFTDD